jgi:hypothetical protein
MMAEVMVMVREERCGEYGGGDGRGGNGGMAEVMVMVRW